VTEDDAFRDLIRRIRAGDQQAAAELVRQYEPEIRRAIRLRLGDSHLKRVLDSVDVYQSVMGHVFVRLAAGQYEVDHPAQLFALLLKLARNKLVDHARKPDNRHEPLSDTALSGRVDDASSPSTALAVRDLVSEVRRRMSAEENRLADLRAAGREWGDIGRELNVNPEALRKKLARAASRVAKDLGLDEEE
jgi:RNA polymerase sigma-70 factor (ECF subfamily)